MGVVAGEAGEKVLEQHTATATATASPPSPGPHDHGGSNSSSNATSHSSATTFSPAPDARVGDGRAAQWGYLYRNGTGGGSWLVVLAASGDVLYEGDPKGSDDFAAGAFGFGRGGEVPINRSAWSIDSVRAAQLAAKASPAYANLTGDPDAVGFLGLGQDDADGHPFWLLGLIKEDASGTDQGLAFVSVDASNGTAVDLQTALKGFVGTFLRGPELGTDSGRLTVVQATASSDFRTAEKNHTVLAVALDLAQSSVPASSVTATVTAPDGTSQDLTKSALPTANGPVSITFLDPPTGDWTVSLKLDGGALADWQLSWCTDGFYVDPAGNNPACQVAQDAASHLQG